MQSRTNRSIELEVAERVGGCVGYHMLSVEDWAEGNPIEYWVDENGIDCVRYESGKWFHYRKNGKVVEWW